jgi:hypothetical protein
MGILDWGGAKSRKGLFKTPGMTVAFCEEFILFACYFNISFICNFMFYRNESGRFGALKSDSTHHFFRNACTKSGSLRFSQFSGC